MTGWLEPPVPAGNLPFEEDDFGAGLLDEFEIPLQGEGRRIGTRRGIAR